MTSEVQKKVNSEIHFLYSTMGFSIIPIDQKSKKCLVSGWNKFKTARAKSDLIEKWFGDSEEKNVGIVCGEASGKLCVIDFDKEHSFEFIMGGKPEEVAERTLVVKTGKGHHLYLKYIDPEWPKDVPTNIDFGEIRGPGKYVVAPPSIHPSGRKYQFIQKHQKLMEVNMSEYYKDLLRRAEEWRIVSAVIEEYTPGNRHNLCLGLAGALRRWKNYTRDQALDVVRRLCIAMDDLEEADRVETVVGTYEQPEDEVSVRNWLGDELYNQLRSQLVEGNWFRDAHNRGEIHLFNYVRNTAEFYCYDENGILCYKRMKYRDKHWIEATKEYMFNRRVEIAGRDVSSEHDYWLVNIYDGTGTSVVKQIVGPTPTIEQQLRVESTARPTLQARGAFGAMISMAERAGVELRKMAPAIGVYTNSQELTFVEEILPAFDEARNAEFVVKNALIREGFLTKEEVEVYMKIVKRYKPIEVLLPLGYGITAPFIHLLKTTYDFIPIILLVGPHGIGKTCVSDMVTHRLWATPKGHSSDIGTPFRFAEYLASTTLPRSFGEGERFSFDSLGSLIKQITESTHITSRGTADRKVVHYKALCHPILNANSYSLSDRDLFPRILIIPFMGELYKERSRNKASFEKEYAELRPIGWKVMNEIFARVNPTGGIDTIRKEIRDITLKLYESGIDFLDARRAYGYAVFIWGLVEFDRICKKYTGRSMFDGPDIVMHMIQNVVSPLESTNVEESREDLYVVFFDWFMGWLAKNTRFLSSGEKRIVGQNETWKEDGDFYYITGAVFSEFKRAHRDLNVRSLRAFARIVSGKYNMRFDDVYQLTRFGGQKMRVVCLPKSEQARLPEVEEE